MSWFARADAHIHAVGCIAGVATYSADPDIPAVKIIAIKGFHVFVHLHECLVLKCSDKILLFLLKQKCASHFTEKPPLSIFTEKMVDLAFKDIVVNQTSHSVNEKNYLKLRNP